MAEPNQTPSLVDVAARAGVSPTTVSRVLNNRGYLSQRTKDRVAQAIQELNYRPNEVARALLGQRTKMIGVIVPTVALPFFGEVVVSLEHALEQHGYRLLLCNSLGRADLEREYLDLLISNRVDGIISGAHNDAIPEYADIKLPLVTIDRQLAPQVPNVRCDNESGGRMATELLLRRGCRRPALLTSTSSPRNRREAGYRAVLAEADIEPIVGTVNFHTPEPRRTQQIDAWLSRWLPKVDGVFATDDLMAGTVLEWAAQSGVAVPDQLRVVGFDGTEAIRRALPGLSTVRQPIRLICRGATDLLLSQIDNQAFSAGDQQRIKPLEFPVTLFEGRTT
nr:LacI family DNA-binding transcriptional regulator [Propionicimonas sp.]